MKIDRTKTQRAFSEVPPGCKELIEKIRTCGKEELLDVLRSHKKWNFGKCELYHWIDVLDRFDAIFAEICSPDTNETDAFIFLCTKLADEKNKLIVCEVLEFTSVLIEHSYARHWYNSSEYLMLLLAASDIDVVLSVLQLLYVFSKRSNFLTRLPFDQRLSMQLRLTHLAKSWGGHDSGFALATCATDKPRHEFPASATSLHFEFYPSAASEDGKEAVEQGSSLTTIHVDNLDKFEESPAEVVKHLVSLYKVPKGKQMGLLTQVRLAKVFSSYPERLKCVQARLLSLAILLYCHDLNSSEVLSTLLYPGLVEELVEVLDLKNNEHLGEIKAAALRTLTSILHIPSRLASIIEITGANSYHGFLPTLVRQCINSMINDDDILFPQQFSTALFSFLYHLASFDAEALIACGMMDSLMAVTRWQGKSSHSLTFVTRAVRVADLITNVDVASFQSCNGISTLINRLEVEVDACRTSAPHLLESMIPLTRSEGSVSSVPSTPSSAKECLSSALGSSAQAAVPMDTTEAGSSSRAESAANGDVLAEKDLKNDSLGETDLLTLASLGRRPSSTSSNLQATTCLPHRSALIKSILNFLKKTIIEPSFADYVRGVMETSLPQSLKHIVSNAEYYGAALFLLAMEVSTHYMNQEPSSISVLLEGGLPGVMLAALLQKEVPATREVLISLPNIVGAVCLNERGRQAFLVAKPFDRLFRILLMPEYLTALRRRKGAEEIEDTATSLGSAMDELIRNHDCLRTDAICCVIKLLKQLIQLGNSPSVVAVRMHKHRCSVSSTAGSSAVGTQPLGNSAFRGVRGASVRRSVGHVAPTSPARDGGESSDDEVEEVEDEDDDVADGDETRAAGGDGAFESGMEVTEEAVMAATTADDAEARGSSNRERMPVPLSDFVQNVVKFAEAILSSHTADDHVKVFLREGGLVPLVQLGCMRNLPLEFPLSSACRALVSTVRGVAAVSRDSEVVRQLLVQMESCLNDLSPLLVLIPRSDSSAVLHEVVQAVVKNGGSVSDALTTADDTPLLHSLASLHTLTYIAVTMARMQHSDCRLMVINTWGSALGLRVLQRLSTLYLVVVWETTALLAAGPNQTVIPPGSRFAVDDLETLVACSKSAPAVTPLTGLPDVPTPVAPTPGANEKAADSDEKLPTSDDIRRQTNKHVRGVLSWISRFGRALGELFGLLGKTCAASSPPQSRVHLRRHQITGGPDRTLLPASASMATSLAELVVKAFNVRLPAGMPEQARFQVTYLICSLGFASPMLFDERKQPYHLIIQQFMNSRGLNDFVESLKFVLSCNGEVDVDEMGMVAEKLPYGSGDFIDSWLVLLLSMVNAKAILDSPHVIGQPPSNSSAKPFKPLDFVIQAQAVAFKVIPWLWNRKPVSAASASTLLSVLCQLLESEKVIRHHLDSKEKGSSSSEQTSQSKSPTQTPAEPQVNEVALEQLRGMGFGDAVCRHALQQTGNSIQEATLYILAHPNLGDELLLGETMDMDEEEQLRLAMAMSMGEDVSTPPEKAEEESNIKVAEPQPEPEPLPVATYPSVEEMDSLITELVSGSFTLLDHLPDSVFRINNLLQVIFQRSNHLWQCCMDVLLEQLGTSLQRVTTSCKSCDCTDKEKAFEVVGTLSTEADCTMLATRLHLLNLLWVNGDLRLKSVTPVINQNIQVQVNGLLESFHPLLTAAMEHKSGVEVPRWLPGILLFINGCQQCYSMCRVMHIIKRPHQWMWFDERNSKWSQYASALQQTIDEAFSKGESSVKITSSRHRYSINFPTMMQTNDDSGSQRPVMYTMTTKNEPSSRTQPSDTISNAESIEETMAPASGQDSMEVDLTATTIGDYDSLRLTDKDCQMLIRACAALLRLLVEPDTIHALMLLCMRLTREHRWAVLLAELGGIESLLSLHQQQSFSGFLSLATMLVRHVLEDENTLRDSVAAAAAAVISSASSRDVDFILRRLAPALARNEKVFHEFVSKHVDFCPPSQQLAPTQAGGSPQATILDRVDLSRVSLYTKPHFSEVQCAVVEQLLALLCKEEPAPKISVDTKGDRKANLTLPLTSTNEVAVATAESSSSSATQPASAGLVTGADDDKVLKPLITRPVCLRLLAELVRSYPECARIVTEYIMPETSSAGKQPVLAFILDVLIPERSAEKPLTPSGTPLPHQSLPPSDVARASRSLLCSLAACRHSLLAQASVASAVRAALARAMGLPEHVHKHTRLQSLLSLISNILEQSYPSLVSGSGTMANGKPGDPLDPMAALLLSNSLLSDVSRLPHALDLASPYLVQTVNAALRCLEDLVRLSSWYCVPFNNVNDALTATLFGLKQDTPSETSAKRSKPGTAGECDSEQRAPDAMPTVQDRVSSPVSAAVGNFLDSFVSNLLERVHEDDADEPMEEENTADSDGGDGQESVGTRVEVVPLFRVPAEDSLLDEDDDGHSNGEGDEEVGEVVSVHGDDVDVEDLEDMDDDDEDDDDDDDSADDDDEEEEHEEEVDENGSDMEGQDEEDEEEQEEHQGEISQTGFDMLDEEQPVPTSAAGGDQSSSYTYMMYSGPSTGNPFMTVDPSAGVSYGHDATTLQHPLLAQQTVSAHDVPRSSQRNTFSHIFPLATAVRDLQHNALAHQLPHSAATQTSRLTHHTDLDMLSISRPGLSGGPYAPNFSAWTSTLGDRQSVFHIFPRNDDGFAHMLDAMDGFDAPDGRATWEDEFVLDPIDNIGNTAAPAMNTNTPSALSRWMDESQLLEGPVMYHLIALQRRRLLEAALARYKVRLAEEEKEKQRRAEEEAQEKLKKDQEKVQEELRKTEAEGERSVLASLLLDGESQPTGSTPHTPLPVQDNAMDTGDAESIVLAQDPGAPGNSASDQGPTQRPSMAEAAASLINAVEQMLHTHTGTASMTTRQPAASSTPQPPLQLAIGAGSTPPVDGEVSASSLTSCHPRPLTPDVLHQATSPLPNNEEGELQPAFQTPQSASMSTEESSSVNVDTVEAIPALDGANKAVEAAASDAPEQGDKEQLTAGETAKTTSASTEEEGGSQAATTTGASSDEQQPSSSDRGDNVPDEVDPSFLAALPEHIRAEVLEQQAAIREQRARAAALLRERDASQQSQVSQDFLAALPPTLQEEVLAQERQERQRAEAQASASGAGGTSSAQQQDPAAFMRMLPSNLRQSLLGDMDESHIAALPDDLRQEAQRMRQAREESQARYMQQRYQAFDDPGMFPVPAERFRRLLTRATRGGNWTFAHLLSSGRHQYRIQQSGGERGAAVQARVVEVVDRESLACLLLLIFIDDNRLSTTRLQRILGTVCRHPISAGWLCSALLSVMQQAARHQGVSLLPEAMEVDEETCAAPQPESCRLSELTVPPLSSVSVGKYSRRQLNWLQLRFTAALGRHTPVFHLQRGTGGSPLVLHPHAATMVSKHALQLLFSMVPVLPRSCLMPFDYISGRQQELPSSPALFDSEDMHGEHASDFWELLLVLDRHGVTRKGKAAAGRSLPESSPPLLVQTNLSASLLGRVAALLDDPLMLRSTELSDLVISVVCKMASLIARNRGTGSDSRSKQSGDAGKADKDLSSAEVKGKPEAALETDALVVTSPKELTYAESGLANDLSLSKDQALWAKLFAVEELTKLGACRPVQADLFHLLSSALTRRAFSATGDSHCTEALTHLGHVDRAHRARVLYSLLSCSNRVVRNLLEDITRLYDELTEQQVQGANSTEAKATVEVSSKGASSAFTEDETAALSSARPVRHVDPSLAAVLANHGINASRARGSAASVNTFDLRLDSMRALCGKSSSQVILLRLLKMLHQVHGDMNQESYLVATHCMEAYMERSQPQASKNQNDQGKSNEAASAHDSGRASGGRLSARLESSLSSLQREVLEMSRAIEELREQASHVHGMFGRALTSTATPPERASSSNLSSQSSPLLLADRTVRERLAESRTPQSEQNGGESQEDAADKASEDGQTAEASSDKAQASLSAEELKAQTEKVKREAERCRMFVVESLLLPRLSTQLDAELLWEVLGKCLVALAKSGDSRAVLLLQPAVEAFFLVHKEEQFVRLEQFLADEDSRVDGKKQSSQLDGQDDVDGHLMSLSTIASTPMESSESLGVLTSPSAVSVSSGSGNTAKFLKFAETHRTVLNQILRQTTAPLSQGPFSVLVNHTRILDFDVKRQYFRHELNRLAEEHVRRRGRDDIGLHIKRDNAFEDSYRELHRRSKEELRGRLYVVFDGEEGQDAGGLLREWYIIVAREIFNPNYALFHTTPGDRVTYMPNPLSYYNPEHLLYFKFVGRFIAKAIFDDKLLDCYFTRSFYKHILGKAVHYSDMAAEDPTFYKSLRTMLDHNLNDLGLDLTFSVEVQEFGVTTVRDLIKDGRYVAVTEENKHDYVRLACQEKMTGSIRQQIKSFLDGFYDIIPRHLISIFNEQELELLISGLPSVDIEDLRANTEYHKYNLNSMQIQWFWRALRSFDQAQRAKFLQFVTGTSKVPLHGFSELEGMNGPQRFQIHRDDRSTSRLPCAHTCFNQLDLPPYETYEKLRTMLLLATEECTEGFGLA